LHAHDDVDRPSSSVQVLDTRWVFNLKINTTTRMIERFKTRIVANGQPQILGFYCYDVNAEPIVMMYMPQQFPWQKSSYCLPFVLTGTWNIFKRIPVQHSFLLLSSLVKSLTAIHPQVGVDIGLSSNGLPRV
jgi:hypothetical protein